MKVLNPNETGTGIMIENQGFISPDMNKDAINNLNESIERKTTEIAEPLTFTAILQKYEVVNKNGRWYPEAILKKAVNEYNELIKDNRATGELEHPDSLIITADRISHKINKVWWDNKTLMGEIEILMSPGFLRTGEISCSGDLVANLIRKGVKIGVSSRGVGSLKREGDKNVVQDDFELICWDIVTSPSTPNAWIFSSKEESRPFVENALTKKIDDLLKD